MPTDAADLLRDWLARRGTPAQELIETHASAVAIAGDRVFKIKKPVRFPFLDLSTPQRRLAVCRREITLNRRFAPDVYLGIVEVTDPTGHTVDHVVEMRRLPQRSRLDQLRDATEAGSCLDRLAELIARFHDTQRVAGDAPAAASAADLWREGFEQLAEFADRVLPAAQLAEAQRLAARYLAGRSPLFDQRVADGRVVDGHGDLRADDVFCLPDGLRVIDCLEFDDRLRVGDPLADVAFLAMDLEWLGHPDLAQRFLTAYRNQSGDTWPQSLADQWIAYRAQVRAKVACLRVAAGIETARHSATGHLDLSVRHLRLAQVRLVLVGGLPGAGKSTVAAGVADRLGWTMLRSDVIRRDCAHPVGQRYTEAAKAVVYDELLSRARRALHLGESVVLDASWSGAAHRVAAAELAAEVGADLHQVRCVAPAVTAEARIRARTRAGADESEADVEVRRTMAAEFDGWPQAVPIDTDADPATVVDRVLAALAATGELPEPTPG